MRRRILVTGANRGIGRAISTAILEEHGDTFVWLGSRDRQRGEAAREEIVAGHPAWADRIEDVELDVSSDESVAAAAQQVGGPLYALVNNAGIGLGSGGLRDILEVNVLGVRRVCETFLPLLDPSRGRIVNITSAAGPNFVAGCSPERQQQFVDPEVTWDDIQSLIDECLAIDGPEELAARGFGEGNAYGLSKALANAYTVMLAREHPSLRINACTPGWVATDMTRPYADKKGKSPAELGMITPAQGARSAMFLLFGEPEGNGRYYGSDAKRSPLDRYRAPGTAPYSGD